MMYDFIYITRNLRYGVMKKVTFFSKKVFLFREEGKNNNLNSAYPGVTRDI